MYIYKYIYIYIDDQYKDIIDPFKRTKSYISPRLDISTIEPLQ